MRSFEYSWFWVQEIQPMTHNVMLTWFLHVKWVWISCWLRSKTHEGKKAIHHFVGFIHADSPPQVCYASSELQHLSWCLVTLVIPAPLHLSKLILLLSEFWYHFSSCGCLVRRDWHYLALMTFNLIHSPDRCVWYHAPARLEQIITHKIVIKSGACAQLSWEVRCRCFYQPKDEIFCWIPCLGCLVQ